MKYTFAKLPKWGQAVERRLNAVVRQSVNDTMNSIPIKPGRMRGYERQKGSIPRDTGFLANSLMSDYAGAGNVQGASVIALVAGQMVAGDVVRFGWTAEYARVQHDGGNGQTGTGWIYAAANRWPGYVARNAERAKGIN